MLPEYRQAALIAPGSLIGEIMEFILRALPRITAAGIVPFLCLFGSIPILVATLALSNLKSSFTAPVFCLLFAAPIMMLGWHVYAFGKKVESLDQVYPFFRSWIFYACIAIFVTLYVVYMPPLLTAPNSIAK